MTARDRAEQATGAALDAAVSAVASPAAAKVARPLTRRLAPIIVTVVAAVAIAAAAVFGTATAGAGILTLLVADALVTQQQSQSGRFCLPSTAAAGLEDVSALSSDQATRNKQLEHAALITRVGEQRGVSAKGWVVGVAVGIVESQLLNLPSAKYPDSLTYPHDTYPGGGIPAGDHTSVGLMQQQRWWWADDMSKGMDPAYQVAQFYGGGDDTPGIPGLVDITGWEDMPVGSAAQAVQRSAFPSRYADVEADATTIVAVLSGVDPGTCTGPVSAGGWAWPLDPLPAVSSPFGQRLHPILGYWKLHDGSDYGAGCGTPIYAAGDATVTSARDMAGYGVTSILDHGGGIETWYAHQSRVGVAEGDTVAAGEMIGWVGTTGYSTGCHLHFMVKVNGEPVDAHAWLAQRIGEQETA